MIGDVRGAGLFIGIELVEDRKTLKPATEKAKLITDKMKELAIILSTDGPHNNVIKIKPPLVFTQDNAKLLVDLLSKLLARLF